MNKQEELDSRAIEVADMMEKGMKTEALIEHFMAKWNCSERTVTRMIVFAKDLVLGRIKNTEMVLNIIRCEAIAEELDFDLMSKIELRAALGRIVAGKATYSKLMKVKGEIKSMTAEPDLNMQLKAIQMLLKISDNAEGQNKKVTHVIEKSFPITYRSAEELEILKSI